jgi:hypothetical protein
MRLYGEIRSGALEHLASKVIGHTVDRRGGRIPSDQSRAENNPPNKARVRVWDERRGAYFLQDE